MEDSVDGDSREADNAGNAGNAQKETPEKATSGTIQQRKLVLQLREYLLKDKNYLNSDINRDEIVSALATNKTYLYDALNVVADKSLQEYIYFLRLEEARRMLDSVSKFTLETVAADCGFNTYRNFSRLFNKQSARILLLHLRKTPENANFGTVV